MTYAKQNIIKYQRQQRVELLKTIGILFLEAIAVIGIFILGIVFTML